MTAIIALAFNSFLRQRRRIAFWVLAAISLGLAALPFVIILIQRPTALGEEGAAAELAVSCCGQAAVFALLLAVGLSQSSVSQEISRRTVHLVLVRPVSRRQFMAGVFLGSMITTQALYGSLALVCWMGVAVALRERLLGALMALLVLAVPVALITLWTTFLSAWMPGSVAGVIGYASFLFGLFSGALERMARGLHPFWGALVRGVNLFSFRMDRVFGLAAGVIRGEPATWWPLAWEIGYALVIFLLGMISFDRRKV